MVGGKILHLDLEGRSAVIEDEHGNELQVRFSARTNVEVMEHETAGLMGGELEDLEEGFQVELELSARAEDGTYICDSVACIS